MMKPIKKNPILTFVSLASLLTIANGFSTNINLPKQKQMTTLMRVATETEVTNDFGSAMPATVEAVDPHVTIGVEPDDLAIGIDPVKFLELIGTKEDLKEKFQTDNKSWDAVRVEEEAVRYMMDCENVNMYLKYLQDRNENPEKYRAEALENELSLSNPKTIATYAAWLVGGVSIGIFRTEILAPKLASGEWQLPSFMSMN